MNRFRMMFVALAFGCAQPQGDAEQRGPDWWRFAADVDSPVGGVWQSNGGACLWVWYDRIQWDDTVVDCRLADAAGKALCSSEGDLWTITPLDDAGGYLGPVELGFPEGRTAQLEPDCR